VDGAVFRRCAVNWATNQPGDNQLGDNIWSTGRQIIKLENSINATLIVTDE